MKIQVKKKWNKPLIISVLKIKQTLSSRGAGTDGGSAPNQQS